MADLAASISSAILNSYQYWQNRESLTLTAVGPSSNTTATLPDCKRFTVNIKDLPAQLQGIYLSSGIMFSVPITRLPSGVTPKVMDRLTDAGGTVWTIQSLDKTGWNSRFDCTCLNLSLALGFANTLTFRRPTYTTVGGIKKISGYSTLASGLSGKVTLLSSEFAEVLNKRQTKKTYEIHVQSAVNWQPDDQVLDESNTVYQLLDSGTPGLIDRYQVYRAEIIA